jgi:hydrogenase maturation protease
MATNNITVLGVGNYLYRDEGVGIRVVEQLQAQYDFPEHVLVVDGGVLGINLMGVISQADRLIVVDAMRNHGEPGTLYRLEGEEIPKRILAKNSLHQVDLLESLTLCSAIDRQPETVILGVEPQDIETLSVELTPLIQSRVDDLVQLVLDEVARFGGTYRPKSADPAAAAG